MGSNRLDDPTITDRGSTLDEPVKLDIGLISGLTVGVDNDVHVFKGIPYATPPLGDLRWQYPQPMDPWSGVRACREFGPAPMQQAGWLHPDEKMSEDCLYLNIWTPAKRTSEKLPVMVWLHGGWFVGGSGAHPAYNGEKLASKGVIVVTLNYRVGIFGFFAHPELSYESPYGVSGNYGLADQLAALEWIQRNIAAFGGDPQGVTLFGESTGATSIWTLMASPLCYQKNLFQRAILQSLIYTPLYRHRSETWNGLESQETIGMRIADKMGCKGENVLAQMRAVDSRIVVKQYLHFQDLLAARLLLPDTNLSLPIIDGRLIVNDPAIIFERGEQLNIPILLGWNADEARAFLIRVNEQTEKGYLQWLKEYFQSDRATDAIANLYPFTGAKELGDTISQLLTDAIAGSMTYATARWMSRLAPRTYLYHFSRRVADPRARPLRAFHSAELPYIFQNFSVPNPIVSALNTHSFDGRDCTLSHAMASYWTQFSRTGEPEVEGFPDWPRFTVDKGSHLEFGDVVWMRELPRKQAFDLFLQIFAEYRRLRKQAE